MKNAGHQPLLSRSALLASLLLFMSFPDTSPAQVNTDDLHHLGYEVTDLGTTELNGDLCRKLRLDNVPGVELPFPKMIMLVRQADNYPLQVDYYDDQGQKIKTLQTLSIERIDGVPASMKMAMQNHLEGTETHFDLTINYEE